MKYLLLTGLILLTSFSFASDDYMETEDGYLLYVGKCVLHEDYAGIKFSEKELLDYREYPTATLVNSLPALQQKLIIETVKVEEIYDIGAYYGDQIGLDDVSIDLISLFNNPENLYRVSYGVGGGNGGYMTFRALRNGKVELVAQTFDGELLNCSSEFMQ